jgi:hypothetical protein
MNRNDYINGANFLLGDKNVKKIEEGNRVKFERNEIEAPEFNMISKELQLKNLGIDIEKEELNKCNNQIGVSRQVTILTENDLKNLQNHMENMIEKRINPKPAIIEEERIEDFLGSSTVEVWEVL